MDSFFVSIKSDSCNLYFHIDKCECVQYNIVTLINVNVLEKVDIGGNNNGRK